MNTEITDEQWNDAADALYEEMKAEKPTESKQAWTMDTETHTAFSGKRFRGNAITCNGKLIGKLVGFSEENAKLIVASVNHAAQLAEALRDILQWFAEPYDPSPKSLPQAKATLAAYEATRQ